MELWDQLATVADRDWDGRITLSEYKAAFAAGLLETTASFAAGYTPFLDAIMEIVDVDGDGMLTCAEHERWIQALMSIPAEDSEMVPSAWMPAGTDISAYRDPGRHPCLLLRRSARLGGKLAARPTAVLI
ncbi:hypothetical protein AB4305_34170 [Nocardia sp. 2YAB30]|uniref:hypothetical protein n=1 Tax=Nocardia sp. 2YAB30 TaxID=3233022 RepID=UPI003F9E4720